MISVSHAVGRLAEIRMATPIAAEDLVTMQREIAGIVDRSPTRIVVCADLSAATIFPSDLADQFAKFFRVGNARLERSAIVVGSATFLMQVERLLREGGSRTDTASARENNGGRAPGSDPLGARRPDKSVGVDPHAPRLRGDKGSDPNLAKRITERRAFRNAAEAASWLGEVLTLEERARLQLFLDAGRHA